MNYLSVPYGLRSPAEKIFFTMRVNFLQYIPRSCFRFLRLIVRRSSTFPLLRRPRLTIIRFWITCWGKSIKFPRSIIYHTRFPKILISIRGPPRVWWSWKRHDRWHPCCEIHHKSWFGCDSFFSWMLLKFFCHCSRAKCRKAVCRSLPISGCPDPSSFTAIELQGFFIPIASLPRAFWSRGWYARWHPCNKAHHRSRFCCDSFFTWIAFRSFRQCLSQCLRANCRTVIMADIEQAQHMIPLITCEISFG